MLEKKQGRLLRALGPLGPGLLAALADNDAGGVISYAVTGAKFGVSLFLPAVCCTALLTYTVQEMAMRLGVVSGAGFHRLVRDRYGKFWMSYQMLSLLVENILTLTTEFIGMSAGLMVLGIPLWGAVLIGVTLVLSLAMIRNYAAREKLALCIGLLNVVFVLLAIFLRPDWSAVGETFLFWNRQGGSSLDVLWYLIAMVGNAVAPWMIFYQNGAYVEKGTTAEEIRKGRLDTLIGCVCQVVIAFFILLIGAALWGVIPNLESAGPAELISALGRRFGRWASVLFGLGLFNAGLLASVTVSLSSSWSVAQTFGWSRSRSDSLKESPGFYLIYFGSVLLSAALVLLPGLPLNQMAVLTQVFSGILMTPILFFLLRFTGDKTVMGDLCSTGFQKIRGWFVVGVLSLICVGTIFTIFL